MSESWDVKVSKAALACCRRSLEALKVVLQAWLSGREKLEERGVKPLSRVAILSSEGMMAREAVEQLLREMGVKFREEGGGGDEPVVLSTRAADLGEGYFTILFPERGLGEELEGEWLTIRVGKPGLAERIDAIKVLSSGFLGGFDVKAVAEACEGFSTLDIVRLVQLAASKSAAEGREEVVMEDFLESISVLGGEGRRGLERAPNDFSEQLYLMGVSEGEKDFSELIHRLNSGERLDRRLERLLARYSFILLVEPEERIVKLARARATLERIRGMFGGR